MQINQYPELLSASNNDLLLLSHSQNVYSMKYSTLAAMIADMTSARMQGGLENNTDLDTVMTAGVHRLIGANTYLHRPYESTKYGLLEVLRYSATQANIILQRLTEQGGLVFVRFYVNAAWGAWHEIVTDLMIQRGTTSASSVTFSTPFASTPTILATPVVTQTANPVVVNIINRSATGFEIVKKYFAQSGQWLDATASISWVAFGTRF